MLDILLAIVYQMVFSTSAISVQCAYCLGHANQPVRCYPVGNSVTALVWLRYDQIAIFRPRLIHDHL
jgi:hypothetical protein